MLCHLTLSLKLKLLMLTWFLRPYYQFLMILLNIHRLYYSILPINLVILEFSIEVHFYEKVFALIHKFILPLGISFVLYKFSQFPYN